MTIAEFLFRITSEVVTSIRTTELRPSQGNNKGRNEASCTSVKAFEKVAHGEKPRPACEVQHSYTITVKGSDNEIQSAQYVFSLNK